MNSLQGVTRVHLVGVGGIGVSALAPALLQRGIHVTGSDPASNAVTERLTAQGVSVYHSHHANHVRGASLVVATSAAKPDNPELVAANEMGIPVWPRARMLGELLALYKSIVVTGAHGKTTITGMLTHVFLEMGLDPTAFIGGDLPIIGNSRVGQGEWAIAEGDESDGSFTWLKPDVAIINNIDADHLDHYGSLEAIVHQFQAFVDALKPGAMLILSADCATVARLTIPETVRVFRYGFGDNADLKASDYSYSKNCGTSTITFPDASRYSLSLHISGAYNHHNALAVVAVAEHLKLDIIHVLDSLKTFPGVKRRMEIKGDVCRIRVVDDYAHHPNEIRATIQALRERYSGRLIAMFQPHLYSRTLQLLDEFATCFSGVDQLILTEIYAARELPDDRISGEILAGRVRETGVPVRFIANKDEVPAGIVDELQAEDTFVTMGAGDGWKAGEALLALLQERREP